LGSYGFKRFETDLNTQVGESVALRLNLARESSGSYRDQQFNDRYSIAPSLAFNISADTKLLLQYNQASDKRLTDFGIPSLNGRPVDVPASTYYGSSTARTDDTTTSHVSSYSATLDHRFNEALSLRNTTRFSDYKLDRYNTNSSGLVNPVALTVQLSRGYILRDESGWFNQTDVTYKTTVGGFKQEVLFGMEVGQQKRRSESVQTGVFTTVNIFNPGNVVIPPVTAVVLNADAAIPAQTLQNIFGLYVQDQITVAKDWKALVGLRFDQFKQNTRFDRKLVTLERTDNSFSPRAGLVWQPSESQSYYASYSRSFQPSAETFALAANNVANAPESTRNLELGSKLDFFEGALSTTAAVFNLQRANIKNADPANPALQINVGTQRTNGLELTASGRLPGKWDISAGYALLDGKMVHSVATTASLQIPVVVGGVSALGKTAALTPRNSAFLWLMKDLGQGFSAGGGANYVGDHFTSLTNLVTVPSYLTVDLAANYKTKRYEIGVNLKNFTNKKHIISAHGSNDNLIVPGPPRQLQMALKYRF
jgi:catecholate siderophore receptor